LSILEFSRYELRIAYGLSLMTISLRGWETFPTPGALTHTRIIWVFSPPAPQVPGVTPGSPLCPWCFKHPFWGGARHLNSFQFFIRSQIDRHFNEFSSTDMTIGKLQKIVTCPVEASLKAKWLYWWNVPFRERLENKFSIDKPMREKVLDDWLHKASIWAQVHILNFFIFTFLYFVCFIANHLLQCSWRMNSQFRLKPLKIVFPLRSIGMHPRLSCALVSTLIIGGLSFGTEPSGLTSTISMTLLLPSVITFWSLRRELWLSARHLQFWTSPSFHFLLVPMVSYLLVLFCSYIMRELIPKNALASSSLPTYFLDWVNVFSSLYVYTTTQTTKFFESHLQAAR
jgi:hypothetical protein